MTKDSRKIALARIENMRQWMREDSELFVSVQGFLVDLCNAESPRKELLQSFEDTSEESECAAKLICELAMVCNAMLALDLMQEESARMN